MLWSIDSCQTGYPLTSITWPYRRLRCPPIEVEYFLKLSVEQLLVFKWSQAQVKFFFSNSYEICCVYVSHNTQYSYSGTSRPWSWMRGSCGDLLAKRTNKYEKVPKGLHTWEIIISNNQRKICSLLLRKTAILTIIILMRRVLGERVYNLI